MLLEAALAAQEAGLSVVPPREDGSKAPIGSWQRSQNERASRAVIENWYSMGLTGIGVVCGAVSGNLETFEFDGFHTEEAEATYQAFIEAAIQCGLGELVDRIDGGYSES